MLNPAGTIITTRQEPWGLVEGMKTLQCTTVMVSCRLKEPSHALSPAAVPAVVYDVALSFSLVISGFGAAPSHRAAVVKGRDDRRGA
ncbi:hypothetical protein PAPYR_3733 [Paratrimastix pyriformis]|uniref:Uncharacterized protein n=1 Tax=Paratrimastix pyriformis TaxID=342808 RepID=A0ABQ8UPQ1_9EUKA|nr:hypothetical protein PAPYR_3733 [Paratrimastix pyriformis]